MRVGVVTGLELSTWMSSSICRHVLVTPGGRDGGILGRVPAVLMLPYVIVGGLKQEQHE